MADNRVVLLGCGDIGPIHPPMARYSELARWAAEWGRTQRQALQEWHALRLPVSRREE